jgi:hypothetical protein
MERLAQIPGGTLPGRVKSRILHQGKTVGFGAETIGQ